MDLDHALECHVAWKVKFRMAILDSGRVDAACVGREDCCDLGLWLQGEGRAQWEGLPAFESCVAEHRAFHQAAGRIGRAINAGRLEEASRLLKPAEAFTRSSAALGNALVELLRAVATGSTPPAASGPPAVRST
jgi:hypothetical protein